MRSILIPVCGATLAVSGCVAFPELPDGPRVDIVDIVENIECEIKTSLMRDLASHYWLLGWATTITLDFETDNSSGGTGDITLAVPLTPEIFGLTLSTGPTKDYKSGGTFSYSAYFSDIAERSCDDGETTKTKSVLTGRTGAGDWLTRVAQDAVSANICPNSIDFGLEFTLTIAGDGSPTITGIAIGTSTVNVGLDASGSHVSDHELTLSAVPVADARSKSDQKKVSRIYSNASQTVYQTTGATVSKRDFRACAPIDGSLAVAQREQVNDETKDDLDKAVAGALLRNLSPGGAPSN